MTAIELNKHPLLPRCCLNRHESVRGAIKVTNAGKVRRAFQFTFERIRPAVIRAAHLVRASFRFRHHRRGVMAADVEESAQDIVAASHGDNWLAGDFGGYVITGFGELISARGKMPGTRKDRFLLKLKDAYVRVPGRRDGPRLSERGVGIVGV